ncbi:hypothetical protein J1G44_03335 [Cellulomonas sp. zg-ZUI199]|uniref:Uncharacterized protein n=1 Tax=Cellulomonas wangleii TaxID=2816956 RepID=A0ABX8D2Z9_9CELL|nr:MULTISPECIES: hypothetical protein [Cellulomonas]MBO0899209.1 hypothetical protein [Cellulomonas sp. zg-ZUI22]MBO0923512.1 hypothetical protein [Cellulomonas wangleii]QVI61852.1 hypothetical protein KG103_15620 [Cellulomonas wangleii]
MRPLLTAVAAALAPARPLRVDDAAGTLDVASQLPGGEPVLVLVREEAATVTCYGRVPVDVPADRAADVARLAGALTADLFTTCVEAGSPTGTVAVRGSLALGPLAPVPDGRPVLHPDVLGALLLAVVEDVEATVERVLDAVEDVVAGTRGPAEAAYDVRTADLDALVLQVEALEAD